MAVKFLKEANVGTLYGAGEVAGFDEKTEAHLIEQEIAKAVKPKKDEQPAK